MISTRAIKRNKELEKYFLDYLKWTYLFQEIPDKPQMSLKSKDFSKFIEITNERDRAIKELFKQLFKQYGLQVQSDSCNDPVNQIIIDVSEYYDKKYGEETILKMTNHKIKQSSKQNKDLIQQMLRIKSNNCERCGAQRVEMAYKQLPIETRQLFELGLEQADYYLFCPKCNTYTMISKSESFGFE